MISVVCVARPRLLFGCALAALATPAYAQEEQPTGDAPPPVATEADPSQEAPAGRRVYTPADFTRYAPKNIWNT